MARLVNTTGGLNNGTGLSQTSGISIGSGLASQ